MPSRKVHTMDSRLGGYSRKVNNMIDLPYAWLGNKHRVLFHDPVSAMMLGYIIDGQRGAIGALRHLALDSIKDKNSKEFLELMALMPSPSRKRATVRILSSQEP